MKSLIKGYGRDKRLGYTNSPAYIIADVLALSFAGSELSTLMCVEIRHADHVASSIRKKLAITSPTSGGRSVGIVRSRTQTTEFSF
jgi:hypothetical protein